MNTATRDRIKNNFNTYNKILKSKETLSNFYYNYYHFHDPSTLLTENNTMIII